MAFCRRRQSGHAAPILVPNEWIWPLEQLFSYRQLISLQAAKVAGRRLKRKTLFQSHTCFYIYQLKTSTTIALIRVSKCFPIKVRKYTNKWKQTIPLKRNTYNVETSWKKCRCKISKKFWILCFWTALIWKMSLFAATRSILQTLLYFK